jgi:Holliday junction DNA helicase RuvA
MYHYIKGEISEVNPGAIVLENTGIGYEISVAINTSDKLKIGDKTTIYIHIQVNQQEGSSRLFGFLSAFEKRIYRALIDVSGVGASTGLAILSTLTPQEIQRAIGSGDAATIQRVKGVGPKAAQRLVLELRGKPDFLGIEDPLDHNNSSAAVGASQAEALEALVALGLPKASAKKSIDTIIKKSGSNLSVEEMIKLALKGV